MFIKFIESKFRTNMVTILYACDVVSSYISLPPFYVCMFVCMYHFINVCKYVFMYENAYDVLSESQIFYI